MADDVRTTLDALIRDSGEDYSAISRLLGRNAAYIQQFIKRGTPRRLDEDDRRKLAAYFRIDEVRLGGQPSLRPPVIATLQAVPRVEVGASAGPGGLAEIEERGPPIGFDPAMLRDLGAGRSSSLSIIRVSGDSMEPTLRDGDDILVDRAVPSPKLGAIHVLRLDDLLVVKRLLQDESGRLPFVIASDNPAYPPLSDYDPASVMLIGRVLWCGRRVS